MTGIEVAAAIAGLISALTAAGSGVAQGVAGKKEDEAKAKLAGQQKIEERRQKRSEELSVKDQRRAAIARALKADTPYRLPEVKPDQPDIDVSGIYQAEKAGNILSGISTGTGMAASAADAGQQLASDVKTSRADAIKRRNERGITDAWVQDDTSGYGV